VKADNTFSFAGRRYEAPRDVRNRAILVRHDPGDPAAPLIVYLGGDRLGEARPLNLVANDRAPRMGGAA
jgi:hypothetical protein